MALAPVPAFHNDDEPVWQHLGLQDQRASADRADASQQPVAPGIPWAPPSLIRAVTGHRVSTQLRNGDPWTQTVPITPNNADGREI